MVRDHHRFSMKIWIHLKFHPKNTNRRNIKSRATGLPLLICWRWEHWPAKSRSIIWICRACRETGCCCRFLGNGGAYCRRQEFDYFVDSPSLKAIKADLTDCIDLLPTMAVLAAVAEGTSEFTGIERARIKESDRVAAVTEGLQRMGIKVKTDANRLLITGGKPKGASSIVKATTALPWHSVCWGRWSGIR